MAVSKEQKAQILKAYFDKSISKKEMETLLENSFAIHPMEWAYSNENERKEKEQKRDLISKVFGISFPRIEWVKNTITKKTY